jgi:hypothetical protein
MLKLRSCAVTNFKSYRDETRINFSPNFTYVLGRNNSGKTTLLEALKSPSHAPHRSPVTVPYLGDAPRVRQTAITLTFSITGQALRDLLTRVPEFAVRGPLGGTGHERIAWLLSQAELSFDIAVSNPNGAYVAWCSWFDQHVESESGCEYAQYRSYADGFDYLGSGGYVARHRSDFGLLLYEAFCNQMFRFRAERSRALSGTVLPGSELAFDADNLVQVLDNLQGRHHQFRRYLEYVRRVLPEVRDIGVLATGHNVKAIRVWFFDGQRDDFAMPLEEAGSGVPNVLAQLYTITMSTRPRLIMIDEPSAFLHPGATRELIRVAREFPQHQYIISSHQPIALDELDNVAMVLLRRGDDGATVAQSIDPSRSEDQQAVLTSVGASLSDVFSADRVLWVEGATETKVFRVVAARVGLPRGAAILPVVHTGDLEGPSAGLAIEIYRRLTESGALLPPAIAIVLDDEGRGDRVKAELRSRLRPTRVEFLPVRMIENIFLSPDLIHEFLKREHPEWGPATNDYSADAISAYWDGITNAQKFGTQIRRSEDPARWSREVHGARVLQATLEHFTENRLPHDKVTHGQRLAKLADELQPQLLAPIETLLRDLMTAAADRVVR